MRLINVVQEDGRSRDWAFRPLQLRFRLLRLLCNRFSDLFYLFFVYIYPYRKNVILKNLSYAFPQRNLKERKQLMYLYYRHLADLITEPFLIGNCNRKDLATLVRYENIHFLRSVLDSGKDVVLMASHYGNWEYLFSLPQEINYEVITAYSPLTNSWLNTRLKIMRGKFGMSLVAKQDWYRQALKYTSSEPCVFLAVADQRPVGKSKEKVLFLGQQTYVQSGAARLLKGRNAVMVYLDVKKLDRNVYSFRFIELNDNPELRNPMQQYYSELEKTIDRNPAFWLWSHNRWKFR